MESLRGQVEAARSGVPDVVARVRVPDTQCVIAAELVIHPWRYSRPAQPCNRDVGEWRGHELRVQCDGVHGVAVVDPLAYEDQIERGTFSEWTADALPEFVEMERCLLVRIRIPRIPPVRCEVVPEIRMKLVRSRLRKNVDAPVPEPVVFGRKRILIDSDLTDGVLGREFSATESIYVEGSPVRSR